MCDYASCMHCGSEPEVVDKRVNEDTEYGIIRCTYCGMQTPHTVLEEAKRIWEGFYASTR